MYQLYATCPQGMEGLLAGELTSLGIAGARPTRGGVELSTTQLADAYRICLWSHLCNRLLLRLTRFRADTPEAVYAAVAALDWSEHMAADGSLTRETHVWTQGQDGWKRAEEVTELAQLFTVMPPPPPGS